jgi:hypothetical protein
MSTAAERMTMDEPVELLVPPTGDDEETEQGE